VHVSSCSPVLVLVSGYEYVATVGNFYTEDAYEIISGEINLLIKTTMHDNKKHMVDHIHLDKNIFITFLKEYYEGLYLFFSL
jgi:hypothetical protein